MSKTSDSFFARETISACEKSTCRSRASARSFSTNASQPANAGSPEAGASAPNTAKTTNARGSNRIDPSPRARRRSILVVIGDQPVEQAHAPAGAPGRVDFTGRRTHRPPRYVQMRPRRVVDEALEKLRRRDRAAVAPPGVLHVGEFRIDQFV